MGFFQTSGILNRRGFFGGAAKAFSPTDIAGLQLWLDATTGLFDATSGGSAVTTDGSAVARWEDQSTNGRNLTQATVNDRPVLKTSVQLIQTRHICALCHMIITEKHTTKTTQNILKSMWLQCQTSGASNPKLCTARVLYRLIEVDANELIGFIQE